MPVKRRVKAENRTHGLLNPIQPKLQVHGYCGICGRYIVLFSVYYYTFSAVFMPVQHAFNTMHTNEYFLGAPSTIRNCLYTPFAKKSTYNAINGEPCIRIIAKAIRDCEWYKSIRSGRSRSDFDVQQNRIS